MNKIYLVGLPASGKTTTAQWLSQKLGWAFCDLDQLIEERENKSIMELFSAIGESKFREIEADLLRSTGAFSHCVISCGGGTAAFMGNMDWMKSKGLTLFLNTSLDVLVQRIVKNQQSRPLFLGVNKGEIKGVLTEIAKNRGVYYSLSKIVWNKSEPSDMLYSAVNQFVNI